MNLLSLVSVLLPLVSHAACNHYYQSNSASSTKRPFDMCYRSRVLPNLTAYSYRYYCIPSTTAEYGNNSVTGFTAFREDFKTTDCQGEVSQTRIVQQPFLINCEQESPQCDIVRYRVNDITNFTACAYNESVYEEKIKVIDECIPDGEVSEAIFCNKNSASSQAGASYFCSNVYYGDDCKVDRLFNAIYTFHGCDGDGQSFITVLQCDVNSHGEAATVQPFKHSTFVAGFVLLLIAIVTIVGILIWYCFWFRAGFHGIEQRNDRVDTVSKAGLHDDIDMDGDDTTSMR